LAISGLTYGPLVILAILHRVTGAAGRSLSPMHLVSITKRFPFPVWQSGSKGKSSLPRCWQITRRERGGSQRAGGATATFKSHQPRNAIIMIIMSGNAGKVGGF